MQDDKTVVAEETVATPPPESLVLEEKKDPQPYGDSVGQVKWFNPKLGYGFITFVDGPNKAKDIFVHHKGIKPLNSGYHTLTPGEYVQFNVVTGQNGLQAEDVTGICGGPLMCDVVCKPSKPPPLNPISGTQVPIGGSIPVPPRKPGKPTSRQGPKNILKYSREGREMMKAMKNTNPNTTPYARQYHHPPPPPPPRHSTGAQTAPLTSRQSSP